MPEGNPFSVTRAARIRPGGLALRTVSRSYSYTELAELALDRAGSLELPPPGRPYLLKASTDFDTLITLYALLELGVPVLPLHPALTPAELAVQMEIINGIREPLPEDASLVIFTSGTTGRPKPAVLSEKALVASAKSCSASIGQVPEDVWLLPLSLARIGGFSIVTRSLAAGSAVAVEGKFSSSGFMESLSAMGVTLASIVPAMLAKILSDIPEARPPEGFRLALLGGAPLPRSLRAGAVRSGWPIATTYGMTETASNVITSPYELRFEADVDFGVPNPGVRVRSSGGQVEVLTPTIMDGYWGREPLAPGSWFATGDIGEVDGLGRWRFRARRSDLIISGGDNVYPVEVEQALAELPWVSSALVFGLPDPVWGSIVTALLVPAAGSEIPEPQEFAKAARERLSPFKCPRRIAWVECLPMTSAGKPVRNPSCLEDMDLVTLHYSGR